MGGTTIKPRDLKRKVRDGLLPAFPPSKGNPGKFMCLGFHVGLLCNDGCNNAVDHDVCYTAEELQPLVAWCRSNWPAADA